MADRKADAIWKKYNSKIKLTNIVFFVVYFALVIVFFLLNFGWAILLLLAGLVFGLIKVNGFWWRKYIANILLEDIDAELYREVVEVGGLEAKSPLLAMESRFFVGNVEGAISFGEDLLKIEAFAKKNAHFTLLLLAEYNFIIGDDAALASACKRFCELPQNNSKKYKRQLACIENYEMFLAGDYETLNRPVGKKRKDALYKLIMSYREGRIALARGDKEKARAIFSETAVTGEKTVVGKMSLSILNALDTGSDHCEPVVLFPNESVNAEALHDNFSETVKNSRTKLIVSLIILVIALFLYFSGGFLG
jgi:hypothetical protein